MRWASKNFWKEVEKIQRPSLSSFSVCSKDWIWTQGIWCCSSFAYFFSWCCSSSCQIQNHWRAFLESSNDPNPLDCKSVESKVTKLSFESSRNRRPSCRETCREVLWTSQEANTLQLSRWWAIPPPPLFLLLCSFSFY